MTGEVARAGGPVQVLGRVVETRPVGAYTAMTLAAPGVAESFRPGHFVALAVGGPESGLLLRRSFAVLDARTHSAHGSTVRIVFSVAGAGTAWLARRRVGDPVDVVGPLGRPFPLPREPHPAVLVGGGYGSAPLLPLAEALAARGCAVHLVLGAATADRLYGVADAERLGESATVTTDDGSSGTRGRVTDVLPDLLARTGAATVYACGPMAMLAAVSRVASTHGAEAQVAVEESMACGIGVCMTCVLPVVGDDGRTRMVRSCVEGPVFAGDRVRFDAVGSVPADAVGAPAGGLAAGGGPATVPPLTVPVADPDAATAGLPAETHGASPGGGL